LCEKTTGEISQQFKTIVKALEAAAPTIVGLREEAQTIPCRDQGITNYPTWIIKDRRIEGVLTLSELADLSGFKTRAADSN